jgi:very-short-patch-repair endonuclease
MHARCMRLNPTPSEQRLWEALSGTRLGVAFRRQVVIGEHIVDFVAIKLRLVIEVDGGYHARGVQADARRDWALRRAGYRVLTLAAELVMADLAGLVAHINACVV